MSLKLPRGLAQFVNRSFAKVFKINLEEAEFPLDAYRNLQEFFIRRLKPGLRPLPKEHDAVLSPCDGVMSVCDTITDGKLVQVKGKSYALIDLLKDRALAQRFSGGRYATIYLSPRDYHRFHIPVDGEIIKTIYVPGTLWPVNNWAVNNIDELFCRNERVITIIAEAKTKKLVAHIAVGATVVGKIDLEYCQISKELHAGSGPQEIVHEPIVVRKGQELGKFMFGSTVVLLMEPGLMDNCAKEAPCQVKMGETLGNLHLEFL